MDTARIRDGIRVGRAKFRAGDVDLAARIWKKALEAAYEAQDYAAMFVLSKNLGDACAKEAQHVVSTATDALQRSIDYYSYALSVIDACVLGEVLGDDAHLLLNRSAGKLQMRVHGLTHKLEKLRKLPPPIEKKQCTTCEELFEELVLDENDGCEYCQRCFDEYYATAVEQDAVVSEREEEDPVLETRTTSVDGSTSSSGARCSEDEERIEESHTGAENHDTYEHLREELVEAAHESIIVEQVHGSAEERESDDSMTAGVEAEVVSNRAPFDAVKLSSKDVDEQLQPAVPQGKITYAIPTLLSLRALAPSECPRALRSCPVHVDSATPTSRSSSAGAVRKGGAKPAARTVQKLSPTNAKKQRNGSQPLSALPSLEMCATYRDLVLESRQELEQQGESNFADELSTMAARMLLLK